LDARALKGFLDQGVPCGTPALRYPRAALWTLLQSHHRSRPPGEAPFVDSTPALSRASLIDISVSTEAEGIPPLYRGSVHEHRKHDNLPRPRRTLLIVASETKTIPALASRIIRLMRDEALQA